MHKKDEEKTAFHTDRHTFYYHEITFDLKNVGATYQRLMEKVFSNHIDRTIEVYVADMVIKRCHEAKLLCDIEETFQTLLRFQMKLHTGKCTFREEG